MNLIAIVLTSAVLAALASIISIYSYGHFARRAQGAPSHALPLSDDATRLDASVVPLLSEHPDQCGLMLLSSNLEAFALRAQSARLAGRSLDLQYYYWKDDLTGRLLIKEVVQAADRGVRVRLLIDDINTRGDTAFLALDSHPNIEVRLFNPCRSRSNALQRGLELILRAMSATRRMHNKAWIADGRVAFVGGRNIGDAYFDASEMANFRDMDLLLIGPAVAQTEAIFDGFWNSRAVIPIRTLAGPAQVDLRALTERLSHLIAEGRAMPYLNQLAEHRDALTKLLDEGHLHWTEEAEVASDPPSKVRGAAQQKWLNRSILPALMSAKQTIEIISPYFIPGEEGTRKLTCMEKSGVRVSVLTNSLAATDVAAVHGAYAHYRIPLIENGLSLFELKPTNARRRMSIFGSSGASLHTKAFIVDRKSGFVGSFNFDPRSSSLNTEMGVFFNCDSLAKEVASVFAEEIEAESSYRLHCSERRLIWVDETDGRRREWTREPEATLWRRIVAKLIGLLPIEAQL